MGKDISPDIMIRTTKNPIRPSRTERILGSTRAAGNQAPGDRDENSPAMIPVIPNLIRSIRSRTLSHAARQSRKNPGADPSVSESGFPAHSGSVQCRGI